MNQLVASLLQVEIPVPVVLKGHSSAVVEVAIGFDDEPVLPPEEIDEVAANPNVDLGRGEAITAAEREEVALEIAAGPVLTGLFADLQAEHVRLTDGSAQLARGNRARPAQGVRQAKIGDGARRSRDWDSPAQGHIGRYQGERAMHANARALGATVIAADDYIGRSLPH